MPNRTLGGLFSPATLTRPQCPGERQREREREREREKERGRGPAGARTRASLGAGPPWDSHLVDGERERERDTPESPITGGGPIGRGGLLAPYTLGKKEREGERGMLCTDSLKRHRAY